jgi:hypothetical protein
MDGSERDDFISLKEAAAFYPGRRPHRATVFRHALQGVRGRKLETVLVGGRRYTTRQHVEDFVVATAAEESNATTSECSAAVPTEIESRLNEAGF